jgi:hypothetical protein
MDIEPLIKFAALSVVNFFGVSMGLAYLEWWRDWEMIPCLIVAGILALVWMWIVNAPERASARRQAKYDREEALLIPLRKQRFQHHCNHPRNEPGWGELTNEERENLTACWEKELEEIERKIDQRPRPSLY